MTLDQFKTYQEQSFDSFCKKVIRSEAIDIHRKSRKRAEKEISLSILNHSDLSLLCSEDDYHPYCATFYVHNHLVYVHNQVLGELLQYLTPQRRDVILLYYFLEYSDTEIARLLKISCPTVKNRKDAALKKLKLLLEKKNNG